MHCNAGVNAAYGSENIGYSRENLDYRDDENIEYNADDSFENYAEETSKHLIQSENKCKKRKYSEEDLDEINIYTEPNSKCRNSPGHYNRMTSGDLTDVSAHHALYREARRKQNAAKYSPFSKKDDTREVR